MPDFPSRWDAEEQIMDAAVERLLSRIGEGNLLEGVNSVSRGDTDNTKPTLPCIWIGDGETRAQNDERKLQNSDTNTFELVLQSELRHRKASEGPKQARRLVSTAGEQLVKDDAGREEHRLGLGRWMVNVEFVRSGKGPSVSTNRESVYTHVAVYRVTYQAKR